MGYLLSTGTNNTLCVLLPGPSSSCFKLPQYPLLRQFLRMMPTTRPVGRRPSAEEDDNAAGPSRSVSGATWSTGTRPSSRANKLFSWSMDKYNPQGLLDEPQWQRVKHNGQNSAGAQ